jgi:hypothetical protein
LLRHTDGLQQDPGHAREPATCLLRIPEQTPAASILAARDCIVLRTTSLSLASQASHQFTCSGALITDDYAIEQSWEVFAFPGRGVIQL